MVLAKLRGWFGANASAQPQPQRRSAGYPNTGHVGYEAAAISRQHDVFLNRFTSADTETFGRATTLRDRSRHFVRNNPYAAQAVSRLTANVIGDGIVPRPMTDDKDTNKRIRQAWDKWVKKADHAGLLSFYGMQTLWGREIFEAGEVLIRKRYRKRRPGLEDDVPLELQTLEADFLDPYRNGMLTPGALAIQGVETDLETNKRVRYWLWSQHPGNLWLNTRVPVISAPVDADEVIHAYELQRTQTRGVPWGTPAMEALGLLADYELAEIVRKKIEASVAGFVINAEDELDENIAPTVTDYDGKLIEKFEPGLIAYLRGGKDIKFNTPSSVGGYGEYKASQLHTIAAAYRMPYEMLSGDLSQVNFSSIRAGLLDFRRVVRSIQRDIIRDQILDRVWEWWTEAAYLAGVVDSPEIPVRWHFPAFEWVDPASEGKANSEAVRNGFRTWGEVVLEGTGRDPDDVLAEINDWNAKLDELGVTLDSDPRKVNIQGVQQPSEQPDNDKPAPPSKAPPKRAHWRPRKGRKS